MLVDILTRESLGLPVARLLAINVGPASALVTSSHGLTSSLIVILPTSSSVSFLESTELSLSFQVKDQTEVPPVLELHVDNVVRLGLDAVIPSFSSHIWF